MVPSEVPVMILSRCILFPEAMLPLRIFEDRYRRMLEDALKSHRMFAIGTLRQNAEDIKIHGHKNIYEMIGVGVVRVAVAQSDGTSNIILQGVCRARIVGFLTSKPYCRAQIEPQESFGGNQIAVDALAAKVVELVVVRSKLGFEIPEKTLQFLISLRDPCALSDLVSFTLLEDYHDKQMILETLDLRARLKKLILLLQKEIQRLQILQALRNNIDEDKAGLN